MNQPELIERKTDVGTEGDTSHSCPAICSAAVPRRERYCPPSQNKFHVGNAADGKHYWLTPPELMATLQAEFAFDFDPCPFPKPDGLDGLECEWGKSNYVNPPFGSVIHNGKKKGVTAWVRKAIAEHKKGKRVVLVFPLDKWVLMLLKEGAQVRNLGDIKWCATEDGKPGNGTGRHVAAFILEPPNDPDQRPGEQPKT